jgi:hypothetical protein
MSLPGWLAAGWLTEHKPTRAETTALLAVIERDLRDSEVAALSPDTQLALAYNAALQVATIALAASGYRASRERKHCVTIQSLADTIGATPSIVNRLDGFRKKRNIDDYERAGSTSIKEAAELRDLARQLRDDVRSWLARTHPDLLYDDEFCGLVVARPGASG